MAEPPLATNHGIKDDHQGALFYAGVDTMAKFAADGDRLGGGA